MNKQGKIRRYKSKDHVTINNAIMKERDVSLKAKGLFALVMSLPDNWDFSIKGICAITKENYTAINGAIHELIEAGYCRRKRVKENGKFVGCDYEFSEIKGSPHSGFLNVENPNVENLNDNNINRSINTPLYKDNSTIDSPIDKEKEKRLSNDNQKMLGFDQFWDAYNYKKGKDTAIRAWKKLTREEKVEAVKAIPIYLDDCKRHDRDRKYPATYLNQKTWEDDFSTDGKIKEEDQEEEPSGLPAGLTEETWALRQEWMRKYVPRIAERISPEAFLSMQGKSHYNPEIFKDIIIEIDNSDYDGDIAQEFIRLCDTDEYARRLWSGE